MFVRAKRSGVYEYLQLVHNERVDGRVRRQVIGRRPERKGGRYGSAVPIG